MFWNSREGRPDSSCDSGSSGFRRAAPAKTPSAMLLQVVASCTAASRPSSSTFTAALLALTRQCGESMRLKQLLTQFLPLKGPRGAISHFWMSLALQSFISTRPNMADEASSADTALPSSFPVPITQACDSEVPVFAVKEIPQIPSNSTEQKVLLATGLLGARSNRMKQVW